MHLNASLHRNLPHFTSQHKMARPYRIVHLNHLVNTGKLTSITNDMKNCWVLASLWAPGAERASLPTIAKQTSSPRPSPRRLGHSLMLQPGVWKASAARDLIVCNKHCNKVKVELARVHASIGGKQPPDKPYLRPK